MAMIIELFGESIIDKSLDEVKEMIVQLPPSQKERHSYLLHEWAQLTGTKLTQEDFEDVGGLPDQV